MDGPRDCQAFPLAQTVKCSPAMREMQVRSLGWEDALEKEMVTHSSTLAGKFPGWRNLVGYRPWGHKELDMSERLHLLRDCHSE